MAAKPGEYQPTRMNLKSLFEPSSVAVIGASRRVEAVGHAVFRNLLKADFQGVIYPINPNAKSILGVRCYDSILDVPDPVDMAVIVVPAKAAVEAFKQCIQKGVKAVVVITAGFKEIGKEGAALQRELTELAAKHNIPVLGPNCLGNINTDPKFSMNASFGQMMPKVGRLAFISQSGALCASVLDYAKDAGLGFSKFISIGNKASVTELELLEYLANDPHTDVIMMYLEDFSHPREMIELCRHITGEVKKPILAVKSGRTAQGAKAASSHTGSLAGSDAIYSTALYQSGAIRANTIDELFDYVKAFMVNKLPHGNRVAILTNAGGPGILATDACVHFGLEMAAISEAGKEELRKYLPPTSNFDNPIDVIGDAQHGRYEAALKVLSKEKGVDGIIVILTPQAMTEIEATAQVVSDMAGKCAKPIMACFMGAGDMVQAVRILEKAEVPHYKFPEAACRSFAGLTRYAAWIRRPRTQVKEFAVQKDAARAVIAKIKKENRKNMVEAEVKKILDAYGFPTLPTELCAKPAEAAQAAGKMGFPVVVKIASPDILHKFDVGGVALHLKSEQEVEKAASEMLTRVAKKHPEAKLFGVTVQKMAEKGREVILGLKRDPHFGPVVMFGLGGTYVEVLKDVTFRVAPVRELGARKMIEGIKANKLLQGVRGEKPADREKIAECILRLSQLAMDCPEIEELDINPLMVYAEGKGANLVDARIILA